MAMVEVIGYIILDLSSSIGEQDNGASATKQIVDLYDTLLERMLDMSSYVRTKVVNVLIRLCDMKQKFPKQRLAVTAAAVAALERTGADLPQNSQDIINKLQKAANVRLTGDHIGEPFLGPKKKAAEKKP